MTEEDELKEGEELQKSPELPGGTQERVPQSVTDQDEIRTEYLGEEDYIGAAVTLLQNRKSTVRRTASHLPLGSAHLIAAVEEAQLSIYPLDNEGLSELNHMLEYRLGEGGRGRGDMAAMVSRGYTKRPSSSEGRTEDWHGKQPDEVEIPQYEGARTQW